MRRRAFLLSWVCVVSTGGQVRAKVSTAQPRLGLLVPDPSTAADPVSGRLAPFLAAFRELGYIDGQNIRLDFRFAENRLDLLPGLAAELVNAQPDVIYTYTTAGALATARATTSIPIVVGPAGEAVMERLAGNFARPLTNVTGFTLAGVSAVEKCLELLKQAAPDVSRTAVLLNPDNPAWRDYPTVLDAAAEQLGLALIRVESRGAVDIDRTLSEQTGQALDGLLLVEDAALAGDQSVLARVIEFARERRLPSVSTWSTYARDGGLLSLGTDLDFLLRRAAEYVHRIIGGARPSELPVQRPAKFRLSVNLDTAKTIDIVLPFEIVGRADEVIE
jgi:putative ABC transport system substrate-binding protein